MYCQFFVLELHIPPENIYFAVHSKRILTLEIISISYLSGIEYPREALASISKIWMSIQNYWQGLSWDCETAGADH